MSCPCGYGNLGEHETTSGHELLVCGELNHIYLSDADIGVIAARQFRHKYQEIAHGLHFEWPPLPDRQTVGFRIWLPAGVPLEADRASIVDILDPETLVFRDPSLHPANYPSPEEIVTRSLSWSVTYGTEAAQVQFDFGREPGVESVISGRLLQVDEHDLLERVIAVMEQHQGIYALIAADLTIEHRIGSLFTAAYQLSRLSPPFGITTNGLPGLGWRAIFGTAAVNAIGVINFEELDQWAQPRNNLWIVNAADQLADSTDPERTDLEDLLISQLGPDYFHTYEAPEKPRTYQAFDITKLPTKHIGRVASETTVLYFPHDPYHDTHATNPSRFDWRTHGAYHFHHPDGTIEPAYDHHELRHVKTSLEGIIAQHQRRRN